MVSEYINVTNIDNANSKHHLINMEWAIKQGLLGFAFYCLGRALLDYEAYNQTIGVIVHGLD